MTLIGYGLSEELPAFAGQSRNLIARSLRDAGLDGVFLKDRSPNWCRALQAVGLKVYGSHSVFLDNENLWEKIAGSRPITASAEPAPVQEWYRPLLPTSQAVRELRLKQLADLVSEMPLDGVWLDFIRWPARWESGDPKLYQSSFDQTTLAQFQIETGVFLPASHAEATAASEWILANAADEWATWRCAQIASFVDEARSVLKQLRPNALLGLFTVPWTGLPLDNLSVDQAHTRIVGQDPTLLGPRVDVLSPMVYHRLCGRGIDWPAQVSATLREQVGCEVWPVIEALAEDTAFTAGEFARVAQSACAAGTGRLIVFNLAGMLADPGKLPAIG